ncbi:enhancer of polycomb homolog 2-like isoform X2 [Phoenix dactylifera]|uniref:Enhancer of polycomb-like protein n=1 Tax=Phoenix dactylifera TaxID=42345 RepID=A0A8B8ZF76_PHODC|nr:enhancer of polycomb homolog 2-like isoform X2 [Phoenix dactylifera]
MSRLSFRPRPLDIHKKLPILKSVQDFEDDEAPSTAASTRNSQLLRLSTEADNENSIKKSSSEIPTPQFKVVNTYERDYSRTFTQPPSYLRGRGARVENWEFVDYDLDNEDEDWLQQFNNEKKILAPERFEILLFKLEVLDHKTRERAGIMAPTFGSPVPVLLQLDSAAESLQAQSVRFAVLRSVYNYWRAKRERWQKPILRHLQESTFLIIIFVLLQPPPPVNDTNPYNVFRPREKAHRLHARRMQRRENNVQSFEKLRRVRCNLDHARTVLEALIEREEKKQEVMESEVSLQRIQIKYKHEVQIVEDGLALSGFLPNSCKFGSSEDDFMDSDDTTNGHRHARSAEVQNPPFTGSRLIVIPTGRMKREMRRRPLLHGWLHKKDPDEPVMLFTRPLDRDKLAAASIVQPPDPPVENGSVAPSYRYKGRMGRGGRIIFDRWNPRLQAPIGNEVTPHVPPNNRPPQPNG